MIYNNDFTCPDGHPFKANAKLRARCPECGKMARRTYTAKEPASSPEVVGSGSDPSALPVPTPKEDTGGLKLIRRGKPKKVIALPKKTLPKRVNGRFVSSKKPVATVKKSTQLVTKKTVSAGTKKKPSIPKVTKRPPRTAIARHIAGGKKSYADEMIESYGFRRS